MLKWYYRRKYIAGLMSLFPEVNFDPAKFTHVCIG